MDIKLILTDMDGTFLKDGGGFPYGFSEIFTSMRERGIFFCVASGRQYPSLYQFFKPYASDMGFVAENGGLVMMKNEKISESVILEDNLLSLLKLSATIPDIYIVLCGVEQAYTTAENTAVFSHINHYYPALKLVKDFLLVPEPILKIAIYSPNNDISKNYHKFKEFHRLFKVVISGKYWIDISNISVNKGNAIKRLQDLLGITPTQTMAFGDYFNDIEMLKTAEYSFAMKNAQPEVKEIAKFITKEDNNNNGVINTIKEFLNL